MCHLLLSLPALALIVFLFLPWGEALLVYLPLALLSLAFYWLVFRTIRQPPRTGREEMQGAVARVVGVRDSSPPCYLVRYQGELWKAVSQQRLIPGEEVQILEPQGMLLVVERPPGERK
jgi:membrane protein implicated in regulation of membrane protease activity